MGNTTINNNPFSNSRFFFINTTRIAYENLAETFKGADLFIDIISNACRLDIDEFIVYGNRIESEIYDVKRLVGTMPLQPGMIPVATQLIPRSKDRIDKLEVYNWRINPTRGDFQIIVMNNISDNSLNDIFFQNFGEDSIGFDAEQFTNNNTPRILKENK